jgi:hypothetical protein
MNDPDKYSIRSRSSIVYIELRFLLVRHGHVFANVNSLIKRHGSRLAVPLSHTDYQM